MTRLIAFSDWSPTFRQHRGYVVCRSRMVNGRRSETLYHSADGVSVAYFSCLNNACWCASKLNAIHKNMSKKG